jgi:hypothetical protein
MDYVRYGCQIKKRYMVILLIEVLVQEPLSKVSLRNQLLVYLLAFHAKYVTNPFASRGELRQHTIDNHSKTT